MLDVNAFEVLKLKNSKDNVIIDKLIMLMCINTKF